MLENAFAGARGVKVFISSIPEEDKKVYDQDKKLRARLEKHLGLLRRQGLITIWHDGKISPGRDWDQEITAHLKAAEVILLLLSSDFLASKFCYEQMEYAMKMREMGTFVIPVYLRSLSGLEGFPVSKLMPLPKDGRPIASVRDKELACYEVAEGLKSVVSHLHSTLLLPVEQEHTQEAVYRDILIEHPPVPHDASIVQRTCLVEEICHCLTQDDVMALVLTGLSGVGKSTLAAQIYYALSEQRQSDRRLFPNEPLWLDIGPTVTLVDAVGSLCKALGRPLPPFRDLTITALAEELFVLLKSVDRLIIFDQFETWLNPQTGQTLPEHTGIGEWLRLLNTSPQARPGRVLLTSHFYPHGAFRYPGRVQEFKVPGLDAVEGIQLLRMSGIPATAQATEKELSALTTHCQGHAQTLVWLRSLFERDASLTITALLHNAHDRGRWIGDMTRNTLNTIYTQQLNQEHRELLLGFTIYREAVPLEAALKVAEAHLSISGSHSSYMLLVLLDLGLLQATGRGCYRPHPVVADFLCTHLKDNDSRTQISAHLRAAGYYQDQLQHLPLLSQPYRSINDLHYIVEAAWHFCQAEQRGEAYRLIQETNLFADLHHRSNNSTLLALYLELLARNDWQPEPFLAARMHNELGEIHNALGQKSEALQEYSRALELFRQIGQPEGIVEALNNLGAMHRVLKQYQKAIEYYQEALRICEESSHKIVWEGTTLNNLGRLAYDLGKQERQDRNLQQAHYREALAYYEQAFAWYQENKLPGEEAITLNNIGDVYQSLGESEKAWKHYWRALRRFQKCEERRGEGMALNNLGLLYQGLIRQGVARTYREEARICYTQALRIFREVGDRWQEGIAIRNLGRFNVVYPNPKFEAGENHQRSLACFVLARHIFEELHNTQEVSIPGWVEENIRKELGTQQFDELLGEVEAHAEQIVEEMLNKDQQII